MFLPYNTDAPLYYPPITTVVLIVVNALAFGITMADPETAVDYALQHGDGLHPIQWITSNFIHGNLMHLVGNMISLWAFGLIVEGKIGWRRMLVLYLGIGLVQNALEQTIALGLSENFSYGASAIIYGLMAMCVVWAPKNELSCILLIWFRPFFFEVSVLAIVGIFLAMDITIAALTGLTISTQTLHLMGAAIGFAVGIVMVRRDWVDCENWDIFSVIAGRHEMTDDQLTTAKEESPEYQRQQQAQEDELTDSTQRSVRALIEQGHPDTALALYQKTTRRLRDWHLPERDMLGLIGAFHKQKQWAQSIPAMVEYLQHYSARAVAVRLKLAEIVLADQKRPAQARKVLAKLDPSQFNEKQQRLFAQLQAQVEKALREDPYDFAENDW